MIAINGFTGRFGGALGSCNQSVDQRSGALPELIEKLRALDLCERCQSTSDRDRVAR